MTRRGFALLIVLWTVLGATAAALASNGVARSSLNAARNQVNLSRARWLAADCLERARSTIEVALSNRESSDALPRNTRIPVWRRIDRLIAASASPSASECKVEARASGSALDVNSADAELLGNLFLAVGLSPAGADSLRDAILDWRDPDDLPRSLGAERQWNEGQNEPFPRNGPFASTRELSRVRGYSDMRALDGLLDVEPGRIALENASLTLLRALPGIGPEAAARIAELRSRAAPVPDLIVLAGTLSPAARAALLARYALLTRLTTLEPDSWIVTATGESGSPAARIAIEAVLVRAGARAAMVRRRTWIE